jgi:hypothetical protein
MKLLNDKLFLVTILWIWLGVTQIGYGFLGVYSSDFFSFGPNDRLRFMHAPIDTWTKWSFLLAFRIIGTLAEVAAGDMIAPWISTKLQDEDKQLLPYPRWKCKLIVQMFFLYHDFNAMFSVFLALTQVDLAVSVMICQTAVLQCWTLPRWFLHKKFVSTTNYSSLPEFPPTYFGNTLLSESPSPPSSSPLPTTNNSIASTQNLIIL